MNWMILKKNTTYQKLASLKTQESRKDQTCIEEIDKMFNVLTPQKHRALYTPFPAPNTAKGPKPI